MNSTTGKLGILEFRKNGIIFRVNNSQSILRGYDQILRFLQEIKESTPMNQGDLEVSISTYDKMRPLPPSCQSIITLQDGKNLQQISNKARNINLIAEFKILKLTDPSTADAIADNKTAIQLLKDDHNDRMTKLVEHKVLKYEFFIDFTSFVIINRWKGLKTEIKDEPINYIDNPNIRSESIISNMKREIKDEPVESIDDISVARQSKRRCHEK